MITLEQQKLGTELMNTLVQKSWESSSFKNELIANPIATIKSATGYSYSPETNVVIEDQADDSFIYLNIPRKINPDTLELTDEQLEMISGGDITFGAFCLYCAIGAGFAYIVTHKK